MKYSLILIAAIALIGSALNIERDTGASANAVAKPGDLVVHEWGTFTSIAGKNGVAIDWRPLNGPSDLPSFVYSQASKSGYRGTYESKGKGDMARVRMETPVIYFYTKEAMDVNVSVGFPNGKVTEWYPQASIVNSSYDHGKTGRFDGGRMATGINWGTIKLLPDESPVFLREPADSHYYPARETDAVTLQVCNADKTRIEKEKFLFYRGVGNFDLPLKVTLDGDSVTLDTPGQPLRNITNAILFENRSGHVGYRFVPEIAGETRLERPELNSSLAVVYAELERVLIAQGLYEKEARAMIETWKDSWFEEGLRVFYILPRMTTEEVLPLTVEPRPKETVRVLVGRAEVITPEMEKGVRKQVQLLKSPLAAARSDAAETLKQQGRFYEPILKSILESEKDPRVREQILQLLRTI